MKKIKDQKVLVSGQGCMDDCRRTVRTLADSKLSNHYDPYGGPRICVADKWIYYYYYDAKWSVHL